MKERLMAVTEGMVLQLQKFSVDDGPGVRTVIFMQGCPLRCNWCSNPETWTPESKLAVKTTAKDLVKQVERDAIFFRHSGGGVTFSGGEPTVQGEFLRELVFELERIGISMWIETCGYFDFDEMTDIFEKLDHVYFDIKIMDSMRHKELTGVDNDLILENAVRLHKLGIPLTVRMPAIKEVNFTEENLAATACFMKENLPGVGIELLPYHNLGKEKYEALGRMDFYREFSAPSREEIAETVKILSNH